MAAVTHQQSHSPDPCNAVEVCTTVDDPLQTARENDHQSVVVTEVPQALESTPDTINTADIQPAMQLLPADQETLRADTEITSDKLDDEQVIVGELEAEDDEHNIILAELESPDVDPFGTDGQLASDETKQA